MGAAVCRCRRTRLARSTAASSWPAFFPGCIGELAVSTVNDLAMMGAAPLALSAADLEEACPGRIAA
jgi:hydrogenase maturation factor